MQPDDWAGSTIGLNLNHSVGDARQRGSDMQYGVTGVVVR